MKNRSQTARQAGLLWFLSVLTGGFGLSYIRSSVIVAGDAAATSHNVMAAESLFRAAIVGNLFSQVFMLFFAMTLFRLFKEVDKTTATVLLASAMMSVAIAVVKELNSFAALLVLSPLDYLNAFTPEQREAMAMLLLKLSNSVGQGLLEIFWTPFYVAFGLLIAKSRYLPRILGALLMIMGSGYALNVLSKFLIPQFHPAMFTELAMSLGALGGIPTVFWLLIKGAHVGSSDDRVAASG